MTTKQARAVYPHLTIRERDEKAECCACLEVLEALELCSPVVEAAAPGTYYLDVAGMPAGGPGTLQKAIALLASLGFASSAGIADSKFTARCAALSAGSGVKVIAAGDSPAFLAPLPLTLLPLAGDAAERFGLLGLRTLGQIAALPDGPLAARFEEHARTYARLARGEDDEPLRPRRACAPHEDRFAFDAAVEQLEPLLFALRRCIAGVSARLQAYAQVCDRAEITLEQANARCALRVPVVLAEPTACAATIFELARVALESRPQLGAIDAVAVKAVPCDRPPPQLALFDGARASRRAALAATLARLQAGLDGGDIVTLQLTPNRSRFPERTQQAVPATLESLACGLNARPGGALAPLDVHGKATVDFYARPRTGGACAQAWAPTLRLLNPPRAIAAPDQRLPCAGPFRLSESWWERPAERDYYQLADPSGLLLVFYDRVLGQWYMQGVFD
jgi:protein ImuB